MPRRKTTLKPTKASSSLRSTDRRSKGSPKSAKKPTRPKP